MSDEVIPYLETLTVELIYRILDNLSELTILCSMRNVSTRINAIVDNYHRYQVNLSLARKSYARHLFKVCLYYLIQTLTKLDSAWQTISEEEIKNLAHVLQHNTVRSVSYISISHILTLFDTDTDYTTLFR